MSTVTEYWPRTSGGLRVRAGVVRHEDGVDAGRFVVDRDGRAGQGAALRVGDDAADDGPVGTLCKEGSAQADAEAETGSKNAGAYW